jgi:DNA-directed RNA polymerase specialized sigma24 family protein
MRKNSKDWNKVLQNLDREFPEPVMSEEFESSYAVDASTKTNIEKFEFDYDLDIILDELVRVSPDAPMFNARYKKVFKDTILDEMPLTYVAKDINRSTTTVEQTLRRTFKMLRHPSRSVNIEIISK